MGVAIFGFMIELCRDFQGGCEKFGRFHRGTFLGFTPESFRWNDDRSRPGTNFSVTGNASLAIGQVLTQPLYLTRPDLSNAWPPGTKLGRDP